MYRQQEAFIHSWFAKKTNRKPLILRGARQVGKSTLVRQFCEKNKITLFEINLEKYPHLNEVFKTNNPEKVIDSIEDILNIRLNSDKTKQQQLLFLDEIQATPSAISCLRYFYEEKPELPIIAAGSLLEFILNDHEYSMPVGRIDFLHMGPMNFKEFLQAKKEKYFIEKLSKINFKQLPDISEDLHKKGLELVREYLFVGGMPEAVATFVENGMDSVSQIHAQIVQTYQTDFVKYARKSHLDKIQKVFRYSFLNPCRKIKYSNISQDDLARDLKLNLQLLSQAKVVGKVFHTNCSGLPLEAGEDEAVYKLLALDVGLMNHMHNLTWKNFKKFGENEIITEGLIAEQFIGQHLLYRRKAFLEPKLNYWIREGKEKNAEIDFIIEVDSQMIAIEVKAGAAGKIRSLHQWMNDISFKKKQAIRFNLSKGTIENVSYQMASGALEYKLLTLPLYMIQNFIEINDF